MSGQIPIAAIKTRRLYSINKWWWDHRPICECPKLKAMLVKAIMKKKKEEEAGEEGEEEQPTSIFGP